MMTQLVTYSISKFLDSIKNKIRRLYNWRCNSIKILLSIFSKVSEYVGKVYHFDYVRLRICDNAIQKLIIPIA